ncbi:hypothetical protein V6N13_094277 [Hibiscus sabdariffa]
MLVLLFQNVSIDSVLDIGLPFGKSCIRIWSCSKATSEADFIKQAVVIGEVKGRAFLDMLKKDPTHWSKAFFSTRSLCDSVDNNIAEAFNAGLIGARHMSIISMFEEIKHYVMEKTVKNKNSCMK